MKVKIKRIDQSLPLPRYASSGAAAFDLYARLNRKINARNFDLIPLNVVVKVPVGYMLLLVPRSSTPQRKGLISPHGIGIIDQDYCGKEDELRLLVYNIRSKPVLVKKGERIAQAALVKIASATLKEVKKVNQKSRGGFGSTG